MNLLITGAFGWKPEQIQALRDLGLNVFFLQQEKDLLPIDAKDVDVAVCNGLFLHHPLSEFANLKYIQLTSAGFDRVPMDEVKERGIAIHNARGVYSIPMAEWAICKVLDVYKGTAAAIDFQRSRQWVKNRKMREIAGKNVAVLGAGNVGGEVAKRFKAFGASVIGYDIALFDNPLFDEIHLIEDFIPEAERYDIVVITLPLTDQTRGMIGREILEHMKFDTVMVNIARGAIIDSDALTDVLGKRKDLTAILDVFDIEPLPAESPLWNMPNVVVSPHNSFVGDGNNDRMFKVIYSNLSDKLNGK